MQEEQQQPSTEIALLPPAARAAIVLGTEKAEAQLRELVEKSAVIKVVIDVAGREEAHRAAMTLKSARVALEKTGKLAREDATAFSRAVIAEEARLQAIITTEEKRVFGLRDGFDAKLAAEKAENERIEADRVAAIRFKIDAIRKLPTVSLHDSAAGLEALLTDLQSLDVNATVFAELAGEAQGVVIEVRHQIATLLEKAKEREAEEARQAALSEANRVAAAEQAEIARVQAETKRQLEAQQAQIAADRKAEDERLAAERAKFEAEKRAFAAEQAAVAERERVAALPAAEPEEAQIAAPVNMICSVGGMPVPCEQVRFDAENFGTIAIEARDPDPQWPAEVLADFAARGAAPMEFNMIGVDLASGPDQSTIVAIANVEREDRSQGRIAILHLAIINLLEMGYSPDEIRAEVEEELTVAAAA